MVKDDKKGIYGEAEDLGVREKNVPHTKDSIYEEAEQDGKKNIRNQDSFMSPNKEPGDIEEEFQKKFAAKGCAGCDCNDPKFLGQEEAIIESEREYREVEVLPGQPVKAGATDDGRKRTPAQEKGVYEEAEELGREERVKPAETDSIYKEAEVLGERTKEEIDDFMAKPEE